MISVYADGSSNGRSNSPVGFGWCIVIDGHILLDSGSGYELSGTNNTAELSGALFGILTAECTYADYLDNQELELVSDSQYTLGIADGLYKPKKNIELATALRGAVANSKWTWRTRWVRGHMGEQWNTLCDQLANEGRAEAKAAFDKTAAA